MRFLIKLLFKDPPPNILLKEFPLQLVIIASLVIFSILFLLAPFRIYEHTFFWRLFIAMYYSSIAYVIYGFSIALFGHWPKKVVFTWFNTLLFYYGVFFIASSLAIVYTLILSINLPNVFFIPSSFYFEIIGYTLIIGTAVFIIVLLIDYLLFYKLNFKMFETKKGYPVTFTSVKKNQPDIKVNTLEVFYFESSERGILIHFMLADKMTSIPIAMSLKEICEKFPEKRYGFYRCHNRFVINIHNIKIIKGNSRATFVLLKDGTLIPVSRSKHADLRKIFRN